MRRPEPSAAIEQRVLGSSTPLRLVESHGRRVCVSRRNSSETLVESVGMVLNPWYYVKSHSASAARGWVRAQIMGTILCPKPEQPNTLFAIPNCLLGSGTEAKAEAPNAPFRRGLNIHLSEDI